MEKLSAEEKTHWENVLAAKVGGMDLGKDPAHDLAHFQRVAQTALQLCEEEGASWEIVLPAAWLHDYVVIPKQDPRRSQASRISAEAATAYLASVGYPVRFFEAIAHAIEAHSFSGGIEPRTPEAGLVQDADRLDALGAIGVARLFAVAGGMGSRFYDLADPFARSRSLDDKVYALDHFYVKLFKIADTMRTDSGKREAARRLETMKSYLREFEREIQGSGAGSSGTGA